MVRPKMINYKTREEYFEHYKQVYCRGAIYTYDGIRVFFDPNRFNHAFYETDKKTGAKKTDFSFIRARYIDWIKYTLESSSSVLLKGHNKKSGCLPNIRVAVVNEDKYVVIINMFYNGKNELCAKFNTAFYADKSYRKIKNNPVWSRVDCEEYLKNNRKGS